MTAKTVAACTLGCKVNSYDTEAIMETFVQKGYTVVDFSDYADVYVINTCTVTNTGDKKSRQMIRKASAKNPGAIIVATGCYAQVNPDEVKKIEGVHIVSGTNGRLAIADMVEQYCESGGVAGQINSVTDDSVFENADVRSFEEKTRAYLKIQDGCTQYCTYCIIPFARGTIRSRQPEDALRQVKTFADNGYKEIVFSGIHVASYGKDLVGTDLLALLKQAHEINGIERIRFSSLEPTLIDGRFIREINSLTKVCDHFHLSLQSGCAKTLERMNRKYTKKQYEEAVAALRSIYPNVAITTDVIVGFPGETDDDFHESMEFIRGMKLSKLHVFPYSAKEGTKAALFPDQISAAVKSARSGAMIELGKQITKNFMKSMIGKKSSVLFEKAVNEHTYEGHTTNYIKARVNTAENLVNEIRRCTINMTNDEIAHASL